MANGVNMAEPLTWTQVEYKACKSKIGYVSKREAQKALKRSQNTGKLSRCMKSYRCEFCGHYHLGGNRRRK